MTRPPPDCRTASGPVPGPARPGLGAGLAWALVLGLCGAHSLAIGAAVLLFVIYLWTDFPLNYASIGMVAYLLAVPLGLVASGALAGFLQRGGGGRWLAAALAATAVFLVHLTSAMVVAPAAALA